MWQPHYTDIEPYFLTKREREGTLKSLLFTLPLLFSMRRFCSFETSYICLDGHIHVVLLKWNYTLHSSQRTRKWCLENKKRWARIYGCSHLLNTCTYCNDTRKYYTCSWTHFSTIGSILVSIITILASIEQLNTPFWMLYLRS